MPGINLLKQLLLKSGFLFWGSLFKIQIPRPPFVTLVQEVRGRLLKILLLKYG